MVFIFYVFVNCIQKLLQRSFCIQYILANVFCSDWRNVALVGYFYIKIIIFCGLPASVGINK